MKTKLSALLAMVLMAGYSAFGTGAVGLNPVQTGTLTFTTAGGVYITNTFPYPFTTPPVMQYAVVTTNAFPITNVSVTTSNFIVSANTTNSTISWVAGVGFPRVQTGTNAIQAQLLLTNTFATPFAFNPIVQISGSSTNSVAKGVIAISSVSPTGFVIQFGDTNQVVYWGALGVTASPGNYNPNYPSITF